MKLIKKIVLPILLSLSIFFSSSVAAPAAAYASILPQVRAVQLAEAAPNNTTIPEVEKPASPERPGNSGSGKDSSFFEDVIEKIAVMFLVYMFLEAINALLHDFFNDGDTKIKITPKEKTNPSDQMQEKNMKRLPAEQV